MNLSRKLNSEPLNIDLISSIFADITEIKLCGLFAGIEEKTRRKTLIYEKHLLKCYLLNNNSKKQLRFFLIVV